MSTRTQTPPATSTVAGAQCPMAGCHAPGLRYSIATHDLLCRACGWTVRLSPAEHQDWCMARLWPDGMALPGFLAEVARRTALVDPDPGLRLYGTVQGGVFKFIAPPTATSDATVAGALNRKADQAEANGCRLFQRRGALYATSQRRILTSGQALDEYHLWATDAGPWACACQHKGLCAHLALLWRRVRQRAADPDATPVPAGAAIVAAIEAQMAALLTARVSRAAIAVRGDAAAADLFG